MDKESSHNIEGIDKLTKGIETVDKIEDTRKSNIFDNKILSKAPRQDNQGENIMAEVDTAMLAGQHADIRREAVEHMADIRRDVLTEGQIGVATTKDSRHDVIAATEGQADRIVDRVEEAKDLATAHAFQIARDTADLRAQVIETINTVKMSTELNALKGIIEGQKNTTYLSDKISSENEKTRALINDLKYHDLNRGLVERNTALVNSEQDRRHYRDRWHDSRFDQVQTQFAGQWAQLQSQIQAFQSQLQETRQGMVNFGTMAGVGQTSTSNNVR
jgi:hypothetical protein